MIFEYALDPALLDNWETIRYFKDNCGMEKGRLISDYPRDWMRYVFEVIRNSGLGQVEQKKLKEAIKHTKRHKLFRRTTCAWDKTLNWLDNTKIEHKVRPFRAVIGKCDSDEINCILSGRELHEETGLWNCDCGTIARNAADMAKAVESLLQLSQHVIFIDRYFNPEFERFRNPLIEMLKILAKRNNGIPTGKLEYHISDNPNVRYSERFDESKFIQDVDSYLKPLIPKDMKLSFIQWEKVKLKNRFIITNIGGVIFVGGLDESKGIKSPARDQVKRMNEIEYEEEWRMHSSCSPFYSVIGEYDLDEI